MVQISLAQMDALCGNALELEDGRGLPVMAMSTQVGLVWQCPTGFAGLNCWGFWLCPVMCMLMPVCRGMFGCLFWCWCARLIARLPCGVVS